MNKKTGFYFVIPVVLIIAVFVIIRMKPKADSGEVVKEISPFRGSIETIISTTGTVLPKNRLEIKPPVNGRMENILVREGDKIKKGQALAWMSSTERATLLDAAQGQGEEKLKYWQGIYKPIALLAPIDGEVIVATIQPGQTITTNDAVVVLSDHLIVRAQVDETDIGKVKLGQKAVVSLDAYPDSKIKAAVEHIYYESKTVNNVTIYEVDLLPEHVPEFFRSGMNASIDFIEQSKQDILLIPLEAVSKERRENYVLVKQENGSDPLRIAVKLGISDGKNVEVVSGINPDDRIILKAKKYSLPKSTTTGTNPFMPGRRR
ncbi:MAG: efflux RND transporter periplasmic adaptor subunit [Candidatus Omnitrophota bacterium]